ncbi:MULTISPECIES: site-specific tyrosine recombinase/integron integrase [Acidiplasma]|jgi:integrase/recombinase XerD|uniref:Tyrosine recombinase XerA n=3 Tax=Acidiplasma TaxID=507753 RepID=A0A0Q0RYN9_9ARCH|nr:MULTISPECIES: site-specific tyrosine recombinase/integron integrase [Acidiplasma]KQB35399.1 integrase [Acidiplasma cupricumulans]KJE49386.1 integrase [Acidiplasma sp. MBA-1]KPV43655.1 integrase [Acidiplasma aeolicum]KQB35905.1 integrase [Acidiplasma aeolicum]WMT54665.1 MAG: tyrosine-type recombinase/integrase [Acidiplasma sp.]
MKIDDEIQKFQKFLLSERRSPYTVKEYASLVNNFLGFINKDINSVSAEDIEEYKSYLALTKNYSKASQYLSIKAIKAYYSSKRLSPPFNLVPPRRSQKMPVYLNESDARRLLESAHDIRLRSIISLFLYTGLRVGELTRLEMEDVDLQENIIYVHSGKGDKDRIVIIPDECRNDLLSYLKRRITITTASNNFFISNKKNRFDTSSIERLVKNLAKKAGIQKKVTPHVLRHTFATSVLRNGGDIRFIQQILGHSSIATTQIYTHIDDNTLKEMYMLHKPKY